MYLLNHDGKLHAEGFRFIVIGNYLMFYKVNEDDSIVNIARIVYGGRDIKTMFLK
jgi:plasmid stabilization system protein ParE